MSVESPAVLVGPHKFGAVFAIFCDCVVVLQTRRVLPRLTPHKNASVPLGRISSSFELVTMNRICSTEKALQSMNLDQSCIIIARAATITTTNTTSALYTGLEQLCSSSPFLCGGMQAFVFAENIICTGHAIRTRVQHRPVMSSLFYIIVKATRILKKN